MIKTAPEFVSDFIAVLDDRHFDCLNVTAFNYEKGYVYNLGERTIWEDVQDESSHYILRHGFFYPVNRYKDIWCVC